MKRKKESGLSIAVLLLVFVVAVSFITGDFPEKNAPEEITGFASSGTVAVNIIGAANTAPAVPTLTDEGNTQSTAAAFEWINYSDPEGDPTTNQFQLSTDYAFAAVLENNATANSPYTFSNLTLWTTYYWRVRTCDDKTNCSGYSNDSFFTYSCPGCPAAGGGGKKTEYVNITCIPDWQCTAWGACGINRVSTRNCYDANKCAETAPREYQLCAYDGFRTEIPKTVELPLVNESVERLPAGISLLDQIKNKIANIAYFPWILLLIILALIVILTYIYKKYVVREIKIDKKLLNYVSNALNKGFTEQQIKNKLLDSGVAEIEIDFIFKKLKK